MLQYVHSSELAAPACTFLRTVKLRGASEICSYVSVLETLFFSNFNNGAARSMLQRVLLCMLFHRSHIILANLRKPGEKGYKIPVGGAFNFVTCANYMFEVSK